MVTAHDLEFHLRTGSTVKNVRTLRGGATLAFKARDGRVRFTVPVLNAYEVVVIESGAASPLSPVILAEPRLAASRRLGTEKPPAKPGC